MYFYVVQDVDSGRWRIVDNSGNVNLADGSAEPEVSASAPSTPEESASVPPAPPSIQGQIEKYLSEMFTRAYSPYYDGLHYKMSGYEETVSDGVCTDTFLLSRGLGRAERGAAERICRAPFPHSETGKEAHNRARRVQKKL